eukprot:TRINITY_DN2438_c0_g1_i1.p1 TRINITY_DN2438_c0_g1~~TRINITY_DN2438_c0_g1_i1.p1  ORF type:complete len:1216 (+),score=649.91 TRINITY_DN2438_c0_g1_i1:168-3650(+)
MANFAPLVISLVLLLAASFCLASQDDVVGCGGFVSLSSDLPRPQKKIDFSLVTILMYNLDGVLKESTECSPTGYYFLPLYDKGNFVLKVKGPEGWHFEPASFPVTIGDNKECNNGNDVNFQLTGFAVKAKVIADEPCSALASGVTVEVFNDQNKIISTTASVRGELEFKNLPPGTFTAKASHPSWTLSKKEVVFKVEFDTTQVDEAFVVSGFDIRGAVETSELDAVADVTLQLFAPGTQRTLLGETKTGSDGKFKFLDVQCGDYEVVPLYLGEDTKYDLLPASLAVKVTGKTASLEESFKVVGFSIKGRVVDHKGENGIANADVYVNNNLKTKTAEDGSFAIHRIQAATYSFEISKQGYQFAPLSNFRVSPRTATLPDFLAQQYHVCGQILIDQLLPGMSSQFRRPFTVTSTKEGAVSKTHHTDDSGAFCLYLAPGSYVIQPVISTDEKNAGLILSPDRRTVVLSSEPLSDVSFAQSRVSVSGVVHCLEKPCDRSVSVSLTSTTNTASRITTSLEPQLETKNGSPDRFAFRNVLPSSYHAAVLKDTWCWKSTAIEVSALSNDVSDLEFHQTGFKVELQLSHATEISYGLVASASDDLSGDVETLSLKAGLHKLCLPSAGKYKFITNSCFKFDQSFYIHDTSSSSSIRLSIVATETKLTGLIDIKEPVDSIKVDLFDASTNALVSSQPLITQGKSKVEYSFWIKPSISYRVAPRSDKLLFYPKSLTTDVSQMSCVESVPSFQARAGKWFSGTVQPIQAGVLISVLDAQTQTALTQFTTEADGSFKIGPLYDDIQYDYRAEKAGYHFLLDKDETTFRTVKLSEIHVTVSDPNNFEPGTETPLRVDSVLISLSSDRSYRNNSIARNGFLSFSQLFPGSYFLKPSLKEYEFTPSSLSIDLDEGHTHNADFSAKRIAFSAFGRVRSLNGDAEKNIALEAINLADRSVQDETLTDSNGFFRLRGLKPGHSYNITLKASSASKVDRTTPSSVVVEMPSRDLEHVDFVVLRKQLKSSISGQVKTKTPELLTSLSVHLYQGHQFNTNAQPFKTVKLSPSNYFEFSFLPKGDYSVRVFSSLPSSQHSYKLDEQKFVLGEDDVQHCFLSFDSTLVEMIAPAGNSPFLLFVVLVFSAIYYFRKDSIRKYFSKQPTDRGFGVSESFKKTFKQK